MNTAPVPSAQTMSEFNLTCPLFIAQTEIADVWRVTRSNGRCAVLKVYKKATMGNERAGFAFLRTLNGTAAAKVFDVNRSAAVIEWLEGPSLGDLARDGNDKQAAQELVAVANKIHDEPCTPGFEAPNLENWFEALFQTKFSPECPASAKRNLQQSQRLARNLLADQIDVRPLHGDLHHDNIRRANRGYCAFDAKGVLGERAYELANAFRNPKGAPALIRDPDRIRFLAGLWSAQFDVDRHRLLQWAVTKCALSIAWRSGSTLTSDPEFDLLEMLLATVNEC